MTGHRARWYDLPTKHASVTASLQLLILVLLHSSFAVSPLQCQVQQIDVSPKAIVWADSGNLVALCCEDAFYVIKCNPKATQEKIARGEVTQDGVEGSFEPLHSIPETVNSGAWVGDCFIFVSKCVKLRCIQNGIPTVSHDVVCCECWVVAGIASIIS